MSTPTASLAALLLGLLAGGGAAAEPGTLRLALNVQMRMVQAPRPQTPQLSAQPQPRARVGLEFASPPPRSGPRSLLRVQLTGDASLALRPRGGGLHVTYRSSF